jgi:hypothetical protein
VSRANIAHCDHYSLQSPPGTSGGSNPVKIIHPLKASLALLVIASGCSGKGDGLTKYPVTGKILVNGEPEPGVIIRFNHNNPELKGSNARFPVGVTDLEGVYKVSTNGEGDGAVEGEYTVTFVWPEQDEPPPGDFFRGAYSDLKKSTFKVKVKPGDNQVETFNLTADLKSRKVKRRE